MTTKNNLESDIEILKEIFKKLEDIYIEEGELSNYELLELHRITGFDFGYDWDNDDIKYFIDGMQRALHLQSMYDKVYLDFALKQKRKLK